MRFIQDLIKVFTHHPEWILEVVQRDIDLESDGVTHQIYYRIRRWNKYDFFYECVAEFDSVDEAIAFVKKHKNYPIDLDKLI